MTINNHCRLTDREAEIVRWILLGFTSKEVCRILSVSNRTIEAHINNVKMKLGVRNRIHMAVHLILKGLVSLTVEDLDGSCRVTDVPVSACSDT